MFGYATAKEEDNTEPIDTILEVIESLSIKMEKFEEAIEKNSNLIDELSVKIDNLSNAIDENGEKIDNLIEKIEDMKSTKNVMIPNSECLPGQSETINIVITKKNENM